MSTIKSKVNGYTANAWEGVKYDSNLGIKEIASLVRSAVKEKYPECKFSITINQYSGGQSMDLRLMSAPYEIFNKEYKEDKNGNVYTEKDWGYTQLNQYTLMGDYEDGYCNGSYLTKKGWEIMKFLYTASVVYNYDDSDGQTDYFDTNFYSHLSVGRWDKPFIIK